MSFDALMAAVDKAKSLRTGAQYAVTIGRNLAGVKQDMSAFSPEMKAAAEKTLKLDSQLNEVKKTVESLNSQKSEYIKTTQKF